MALSILAMALAIATGLIIILALLRVVQLMRQITHSLVSLKLLLGAVERRTEPVTGYVEGIGANVADLAAAVGDIVRMKVTSGKHAEGGR